MINRHNLIYIVLAVKFMLTACTDQELNNLTSDQEKIPAQSATLQIGRGYTSVAISSDELEGFEGCILKKQGDFFFLSDTLVRNGQKVTIEVEQNPFNEARTGSIAVVNAQGCTVRSIQISQAQSSSQTQADAYCDALQRSYGAGYGYNGFGCYAAYKDIRDQVISLPALQELERKLHTSIIVDDFRPNTETTILEGNDSETLLRSLSAHAGISADLLIMHGEIKMSYASSDLKRNAYSFCTILNNYTMASRHLDPYTLRELSVTYPEVFSAGFRHIIQRISHAVKQNNYTEANQVIEEMNSLFGTHFIYYAELGGKLTYTSTFERAALNSETRLSKAAEASFFNMCGFESEENQKNTYSQISERHSRKLVACGGDVILTSQIINSGSNQLDAGIIDKWYKSIKFDQNQPEKSNVELIGIRLFPIYLLVTDPDAQKYIEAYYNLQSQEAYDMFPRSYNPTYATLNVTEFTNFKEDTKRGSKVLTYTAGDEVIGEMMVDLINGNEYISFYPVIEGEVTTESLSLHNDNWYHIRWKSSTEHIITPCGTTNDFSTIFYNNGFLSQSGYEDKNYSKPSSTVFKQYTWKGWIENFWKVGSYLLMEAPKANFGKSNEYEEDYYQTVAQDYPHGFTYVNKETADHIEKTIKTINYYNSQLWSLSPFIIFNHYEDSRGYEWKIGNQMKSVDINARYSWNAFNGRLIYCRTKSFRYP